MSKRQSQAAAALVRSRDPNDLTAQEAAEAVEQKARFERYIKPKLDQYQIDAYYRFLSIIESSVSGQFSAMAYDGVGVASAVYTPKNPIPVLERGQAARRIELVAGGLSGADRMTLDLLLGGKTLEDIGRMLDGFSTNTAASAAGLARVRSCLDQLCEILDRQVREMRRDAVGVFA